MAIIEADGVRITAKVVMILEGEAWIAGQKKVDGVTAITHEKFYGIYPLGYVKVIDAAIADKEKAEKDVEQDNANS